MEIRGDMDGGRILSEAENENGNVVVDHFKLLRIVW
jgi:hypothetical protein